MFFSPHQGINEEQKTMKKYHKHFKNMPLLVLQRDSLKSFCAFLFWIMPVRIDPASSLSFSHLHLPLYLALWLTADELLALGAAFLLISQKMNPGFVIAVSGNMC